MSKLNPNAGEFVPSFSAPAPAPLASGGAPAAATSPGKRDAGDAKAASEGGAAAVEQLAAAAGADADAFDEDGAPISYEGYSPALDRYIYSKEFLLAFKPLCDRTLSGVPDPVRNPSPPPKIGRVVKGRQTYSIAELLEFQPLYQMMPEDFTWADTLGADAVMSDKKKAKKQKDKKKANGTMSYDASLALYFNPTEYAAAIGLYTGPPAAEGGVAGDQAAGAASTVSPVEEAIIAKRRFAPLLDDLKPESVDSILTAFLEIPITCTHTLQEIIGLLFDRAIADPSQCDVYAQICCGIADRTPEFKDGAKTVNFRRLLLTKCYESLIEEPESGSQQGQYGGESSSSSHVSSAVSSGGTSAVSTSISSQQHSWRRQCMLRNVGLIGELFRRQLLTENIMHVCVAMMLDDEVTPQPEIIAAACGLLALVGDLLDGSSPASRRTMDEYFAVLDRVRELATVPESTKELIVELVNVRTSGWVKKKTDAVSPAKANAIAAAVGSSQ